MTLQRTLTQTDFLKLGLSVIVQTPVTEYKSISHPTQAW